MLLAACLHVAEHGVWSNEFLQCHDRVSFLGGVAIAGLRTAAAGGSVTQIPALAEYPFIGVPGMMIAQLLFVLFHLSVQFVDQPIDRRIHVLFCGVRI